MIYFEILFYLLIVLVIHSYLLYPVILKIISAIYERKIFPVDRKYKFSIVISAYNEENVIEKKIRNFLELEYDPEFMELLILSDGSSDGTNKIIKSYDDKYENIRSYLLQERQGKSAVLNTGIAEATGDVIVFTDADTMFPVDTIKKFNKSISDPDVGAVTGSTIYLKEGSGEMGESTSIYSKLESYIKFFETKTGSCVGADGAIFAIKKEFYKTLKEDDINDLVIPLNVILQNKRVIYDSDIICYEPSSSDLGSAYKRQARITNRTLRALFRNIELLNIFKYKFFSFKIFSHKFIRLSVPFFMALLIPVNLVIIDIGWVYQLAFFSQLLFYFLCILGVKITRFTLFTHFILIQFSISYGWFLFLTGKNIVTWSPRQ